MASLADGAYSFELSHGETIRFMEIPFDTGYTLEETSGSQGYNVTGENVSGRIGAAIDENASERDDVTGGVSNDKPEGGSDDASNDGNINHNNIEVSFINDREVKAPAFAPMYKYLVMPEDSPVPDVSFAYTITGTKVDSDGSEGNGLPMFEGIVARSEDGEQTAPVILWDSPAEEERSGNTSDGVVHFLPADQTTSFSKAAAGEKIFTGLNAGMKFAKHSAVIRFEGITFTEPGVYRYKITEAASGKKDRGITNDPNPDRYLNVYVEVNDREGLQVCGYSLFASATAAQAAANQNWNAGMAGNMSLGYTNRYESYYLEISKMVSGNQASRNKYFKFHVKMENAPQGAVYDISLKDDGIAATHDGSADAVPAGNSDTVYSSMKNPAFLTAKDGLAEGDFYLKHGQKIVIRGLAVDTKCTVEEIAEDYTASYVMNGKTERTEENVVTFTQQNSDNTVLFTNVKEETVKPGGGGGLIRTPESETESEPETITPGGGGGGGLTWTPESQEKTSEAETDLPEEESEALSEAEQEASEAQGTAGKPKKRRSKKDSDNKRDKEKGKKDKEEEKKESDYGRGVYGEDREKEQENGVRGADRERQSEGAGASYGLLGDFLGSPRTGDETDLLLYVLLLLLAGGGALVITVYLWHRKKRVE